MVDALGPHLVSTADRISARLGYGATTSATRAAPAWRARRGERDDAAAPVGVACPRPHERSASRSPLACCCAPLLALGVSTAAPARVTTTRIQGRSHAVAQTISNLQTDATARERAEDLRERPRRAPWSSRLGAQGGCEAAIKTQLNEIDTFELSGRVGEVERGGTAPPRRAGKQRQCGQDPSSTVCAGQGRRQVEDLELCS